MKMILRIFLLIFIILGITIIVFWQPDLKKHDLEQKYSSPTSHFINIKGDRLHIRDTGNPEGPVVIFIHGFGASLHTWENWSTALEKNYRVIRFDLPGFGLSETDLKRDYSDDRTNDILLGLLEQLDVKKMYLVGNSIGGRIAWYFSAKHPELVAKLVLISPDGFESPGMAYNKAPEVPSYMDAIQYIFPKLMFKKNLEFAYAKQDFLTQTLFLQYYELALYPGHRKAMLDRMRQTVLQDPRLYLKNIHCPVLLLWGEKDGMIPISNAKDYLALLPQATLQRIENIGHLPQEEDSAGTLPYLIDFFQAK